MSKKNILYILLLISSNMLSNNSADYCFFDNISLDTRASLVNCFLQDSQGLIWICSDEGLYSYDGYSSKPHFSRKSPENVRIYCGEIVNDSLIYLGADNGIHIYNYHLDIYEYSDVDFPNDVRALILVKSTLWIGSIHGLYSYDLNNKKLKHYTKEKYTELAHETVYSLILSNDSILYIGTYNGLSIYDPRSNSFNEVSLPISQTKNNLFINSLLEDNLRECIWIGTEGSLFKYTYKTDKTEEISSVQNNSIKSLAFDNNNQLLIGTDNGLYIYNDKNLMHREHDSRNSQSLSNNIVWCIFKDRDDNMWIGTDYGISLSQFNQAFNYIPISVITGKGEGNHFYSIYKDSSGNFWLGGTNGLIRTSDIHSRLGQTAWYKIGDKDYPLPHNRVRHIMEDSDKYLWVATDGGVNRYDKDTEHFIKYNITDDTGSLNANWAYNIQEDKNGQLWISTWLGGLFVVNKDSLIKSMNDYYVADYHYSIKEGLSSMFVKQTLLDSYDNAWVLLYSYKMDKINVISNSIGHIPFISDNEAIHLTYAILDSQEVLWVGFNGGILNMKISDNSNPYEVVKFGYFDTGDVLAMTEVEEEIWVTTNDGLWIVDKHTKDTRRLNFINEVFTSIYYDKSNKCVYVGGVDGLTIIFLDALDIETTQRPIFITDLRINNNSLLSKEIISGKDKSIRYTNRISLNHNQNNLYFEISDFEYRFSEKNRFLFKLENSDTEWQTLPTGDNRIMYNNLSPGKYQLHVTTLNDLNHNINDNVILYIRIKSPWYYTTTMKLTYILLLISLLIWIFNFFRVKNNLKLERIEKERIMEQTRSKINFFTNMSHDFKTPLSMIISPISNLLLETKDSQQKHQLELVQRNAVKLNSLIHRMIDLNKMDIETDSDLILSKIELISFVKATFDLFKQQAERKNIKMDFIANVDRLYMEADLSKLDSILDNVLSNALNYTSNYGSISVSLNRNVDERLFHIIVEDTGIGIPEKDLPYIFQRFFQSSVTDREYAGTGIGLFLVKKYTELHGGTVSVHSQKNKGATVIISLPLMKERSLISTNIDIDENVISGNEKPLVLIVEDDDDIANFIYHLLESTYRCQIAKNGEQGLKLAKKTRPDLIITDLMMPIMDGLEMSKHVRAYNTISTTPIILLTAKDDKQTELESIQENVNCFIRKPFEVELLLSRIEQLLFNKQEIEKQLRIDFISSPKELKIISQDEKFLSDITNIIEKHISDPDLNVSTLVEISGINNKQLYRKITQLTGMTPVRYIRSIRLKKAAMLLKQKTFTVAEAMYMVGYSNHSYFSKCFTSEFGKTPKEFIDSQ